MKHLFTIDSDKLNKSEIERMAAEIVAAKETPRTPAVEQLTDEAFAHLIAVANRIKSAIYHHGGLATKSAVEDVMMVMYDGLTRGPAHDVMNYLEYHHVPVLGEDEVTLDEFAPYLKVVEIQWWKGDPLHD